MRLQIKRVKNYKIKNQKVVKSVLTHVFKNQHGSTTGMREVAVMDADMQVVFLHIFEELAERHRDDLLFGEANFGFIMATSLEVDQTSRTLLSTAATTLCFHECSACHNFEFLKGVHHEVINDLSFCDVVKNVVLIRKDARKPTDRDNYLDLHVPKKIRTETKFGSGQSSSVKYIFNYIRGGERSPVNVNKMDQLD